MLFPSAVRGSSAAGAFRPVLGDPLGWAREVTLGLSLACAGAVASTLLTLSLTSFGMQENAAMIGAFGLTLTGMATLLLALRHSRRSRPRDQEPAVDATRSVGGAARFSSLNVVIEHDSEGYYVASVVELPGCHTQARSLDELTERIKEAVELYLEVEA